MKKYTEEELKNALIVIESTIINCENMKHKFKEKTSQNTLLKNRINALNISKSLIIDNKNYKEEELKKALKQINSIISKSENGIKKFSEGNSTYTRFSKIIKAMSISKNLIEEKLEGISKN